MRTSRSSRSPATLRWGKRKTQHTLISSARLSQPTPSTTACTGASSGNCSAIRLTAASSVIWMSASHRLPMQSLPLIRATDLTEVGAVRDRSADRVNRLVVDNKIEIGSVRTEWVIAGRANLRAGLPPAVLATDDVRRKGVIHPRPRPDAPGRGLNVDPVASVDAALGRCRRMQLDLRIERAPPQTRQRPMLALTEEGVLGAGEDQRETCDQVRSRHRTDQRLGIFREGRIAVR